METTRHYTCTDCGHTFMARTPGRQGRLHPFDAGEPRRCPNCHHDAYPVLAEVAEDYPMPCTCMACNFRRRRPFSYAAQQEAR